MALHFLSDMNTNQVKELQKKTHLAFLPIGPTEVHGRHLPMKTDSACAQKTSMEAASKLSDEGIESIIAPTLTHCLADLVNSEVGNITLRYETVASLVEDVCVGLAKWEFNRIMIVCGHGEDANMKAIAEGAERAMKKNSDLKVMLSDWWPKSLPSLNTVCKEAHPEWDFHAGEAETAQMMYLEPELVDEEALAKLEPNWRGEHFFEYLAEGRQTMADAGAPLTYFGDPRIATRETGKRIFELYANIVVDEVHELLGK
ncbi:MAG: creatininase family protein [Frisingicoccus sp.]|uniref:creatininase family protein n=1 Tax=Frisingicoccus sp. TaxID=1918627 RepID=UPI002A82E4EB|nr:creatininase family protein [Frisingicoccus sp.]MDY4835849.1 creatininase family protein [Frisingicoccus sp.]